MKFELAFKSVFVSIPEMKEYIRDFAELRWMLYEKSVYIYNKQTKDGKYLQLDWLTTSHLVYICNDLLNKAE